MKEPAECHSWKLEKVGIRRKAVQGERTSYTRQKQVIVTDLSLVWEATAKIFDGSFLRPILFNQTKFRTA